MDERPTVNKLKIARPLAQLREGRTDWYRIQNLAGTGAAEVWIYEEIGYWGVTAQDFVRDLVAIDAERIDVHINTPGGDVFDGLAIYQALRNHPARITTYVDSLAASCGSFIAMAGDERLIAPHASMMIHDAWGFCVGGAEDMTKMAAELARISDNIASIYATRSGLGDKESWREAMLVETWYSAEEAVSVGLAQRIQKDTKADAAPGGGQAVQDSWDLSIFNFAGRANAPAPRNITAAPPVQEPPAVEAAADVLPECPAAEPETVTDNTEEDNMSTLTSDVRSRLGLADDATDEDVLAAIDTLQTPPAADPVVASAVDAEGEDGGAGDDEASTDAPQAAPAAAEPVAVASINDEAMAEIKRLSAELAAIKAKESAGVKKALFDDAVKAGKITPAERKSWETRYDKAPEVITDVISAMAPGVAVPVDSAGYTGSADTTTDAQNAEFDRLFSTPAKTGA